MFWDEVRGKYTMVEELGLGLPLCHWSLAVISYDSGVVSVEKQEIPSLLQNVLAEN